MNNLKSDLRRRTQENQAFQSWVHSHYYVLGGFGKKLFGSTVSEMYDQSMDDDSFDLIEKLIGHGGNKKYYENINPIEQKSLDSKLEVLKNLCAHL